MTARQTLLDGLARDADILELVSELAPLHPRDNTLPGEVFLHLAADACGAGRPAARAFPSRAGRLDDAVPRRTNARHFRMRQASSQARPRQSRSALPADTGQAKYPPYLHRFGSASTRFLAGWRFGGPGPGRGPFCPLFPIAAGSCERRWRVKGRAAPA